MTDKGNFRMDAILPIRKGYTISRNAGMGKADTVTYFSMGPHTSISPESYDSASLYLGCWGKEPSGLGRKEEGKNCQPVKCLLSPEGHFADPKPKMG